MSIEKNIIVFIVIIILLFVFMIISPVLFQEGNPIPILKGIVKLILSNDDIVQISDNPVRYISGADDGKEPLIGLMNKAGWNFEEQLGSGYVFSFSKDDRKRIVTSVMYTRKYRIWKL